MMLKRLSQAAVLTVFATLIGPVSAPAAQAAAPAQDKATQAPAPVVGELMRVDPDAKTIAIKTAAGVEQTFRYTDSTAVTGAEKSVAGLATMSGAQVTVSYRVEGNANIATAIAVRNKT